MLPQENVTVILSALVLRAKDLEDACKPVAAKTSRRPGHDQHSPDPSPRSGFRLRALTPAKRLNSA